MRKGRKKEVTKLIQTRNNRMNEKDAGKERLKESEK